MKPEMKLVHPIAQHLLEAGHRLGQCKKPKSSKHLGRTVSEPGFSKSVLIARACIEETFILLSAITLQTHVPCGTGEQRQQQAWEKGGQLVGREEQRTRKNLVGKRTRQEEWGTCLESALVRNSCLQILSEQA